MKMLHQQTPAWSTAQLCHTLSVPRSSFYYRSTKRDETPLKEALAKTAGEWPRYGSERVTAQMRREQVSFHGGPVGERRVRRLLRQMGLSAKVKPRKRRTTNSDHPFPRFENLVKERDVVRPDQVWVWDITAIALASGFIYLAVLMDVFTRAIGGWFLSRRPQGGDLTLTALRRALSVATPQIHHSDQGVQYAATGYVATLEAGGVTVSMACVGCPEENGYAERLMRTIKEEHVSLTEYPNFEDALAQIGQFLDDVYQHKRIHSSLGYLTPAEFEARWRQEAQ